MQSHQSKRDFFLIRASQLLYLSSEFHGLFIPPNFRVFISNAEWYSLVFSMLLLKRDRFTTRYAEKYAEISLVFTSLMIFWGNITFGNKVVLCL
mgnify:FL=1